MTMIDVRQIFAGLTLAALMASAVASGAAAQANCDWYAKTALKQQQDNDRLKCDLKGPAWTMDLKAHQAWCAGVGPDEWKKQAQLRDQELASCQAKKK
jgi:hypothetical protein